MQNDIVIDTSRRLDNDQGNVMKTIAERRALRKERDGILGIV